MSVVEGLHSAGVDLAGHRLSLMEVIGIGFGLACAIGGMLCRVGAWPVGIVGTTILCVVHGFLVRARAGRVERPDGEPVASTRLSAN